MRSNVLLSWLPVIGLMTAMPVSAQPAQSSAQEAPIVIVHRLAPSSDVLVRTVYVADLDLRSAAGQQEMEKRVGKAVEDMCVITSPLPSYKGPLEKPCRDEAWASARPQMDLLTHSAGGSK